MTFRISLQRARQLGLVTESECDRLRRSGVRDPSSKAGARRAWESVLPEWERSTPQAKLFAALRERRAHGWVWEARNVIPDRRFSVDIIDENSRTAIEVDGWAYHGKYKQAFLRDREKDELLRLNGWRVIRVAASRILRDPAAAAESVLCQINASP